MVHTTIIKWFLLFSLIPLQEGSRMLWKVNEFAPIEGAVKTILQSCYENHKSSHPIVIYGDFDGVIDESSIIRMNYSKAFEDSRTDQLDFKVGRMVLVIDSLKTFRMNLKNLRLRNWWNHMAEFIIITKYTRMCGHIKKILNITWAMSMINSIYICAKSSDTIVLYTLNLMANYAPDPWQRVETRDNFNLFRQVFDSRISCKNLHFDKTQILNGYKINVVGMPDRNTYSVHHRNDSRMIINSDDFYVRPLQLIIRALNASCTVEVERTLEAFSWRYVYDKTDIMMTTIALGDLRDIPYHLYPHTRHALIAVVKLQPEITTLKKISKLWSLPVLAAAAIALALFTLILTIKNHNFVLAMLDIVRLLVYTSIRTNVRSHSFRIYFTVVLILMVISNGVFQGKIAAFLTTRDRAIAVGTIEDFADMGYKMFTVSYQNRTLNQRCPKCSFKSTSYQRCIEYVLNNTDHLCVIWADTYHAEYSHLPLDFIHEPVMEDFAVYICRVQWPLKARFDGMFLRLVESGIIDFWKEQIIHEQKQKRAAKEDEWLSTEYRPIKLYKLAFAFQVLAIGLLISLIVFVWELKLA